LNLLVTSLVRCAEVLQVSGICDGNFVAFLGDRAITFLDNSFGDTHDLIGYWKLLLRLWGLGTSWLKDERKRFVGRGQKRTQPGRWGLTTLGFKPPRESANLDRSVAAHQVHFL